MRLSSKATFVEFEPKLSGCRNPETNIRDGQLEKQIGQSPPAKSQDLSPMLAGNAKIGYARVADGLQCFGF